MASCRCVDGSRPRSPTPINRLLRAPFPLRKGIPLLVNVPSNSVTAEGLTLPRELENGADVLLSELVVLVDSLHRITASESV